MMQPRFSFDYADRVVHAHDASLYRMLPRAVARPQTELDVIQLIEWAKLNRSSLTFRAGGTSLSGQAVTNEVLVLLERSWDFFESTDDGMSFRCGPALRGSVANSKLARRQRRIGPDPASISAACMGGIVANNASGMCCGIEENSFRTLIGLRLILASGHVLETHSPECNEFLRTQLPDVYQGLLNLRDKVRSSSALCELIRRKYAIKNTMGYALESFLDFDDPSDILAHLIVGSEGTLAFISQIHMKSVPLRPFRSTSLMLFDRVEDACALTPELRAAGCSAIEFLDHNSIKAISHHSALPDFLRDPNKGNAALLAQIQASDAAELNEALEKSYAYTQHKTVSHTTGFFNDGMRQQQLWDLRKGIFPAVGARRAKGTSVIIEDIAFPQDVLSQGTAQLQYLLEKHSYHDAVIYGHARDGNLHFILAQNFSIQSEVDRYARFIDDLSQSVAIDFAGSLKAEHGTGRNMAPFIELEWGSEAYEIMREVKRILDPHGVFNAGVMINPDKKVHLKNLKVTPLTDEEIDSCIECGFCEPVCPSVGFTLSPRGRIVLEREKSLVKNSPLDNFRSEGLFQQIETCAADGLCSTACPVGINTGTWVKKQRSLLHTEFKKFAADVSASDTASVEAMTKVALRGVKRVGSVFGEQRVQAVTRLLNRTVGLPEWKPGLSGNYQGALPGPSLSMEYLVFRSCVTRACGLSASGEMNSQENDPLYTCALRAGITAGFVFESGQCCGQPWESKGFFDQSLNKSREVLELLYEKSDCGRIPVVIDNSPCEQSLNDFLQSSAGQDWLNGRSLNLLDPVDFALHIVDHLKIVPFTEPVLFFPPCSLRKTGRVERFMELARKVAPNAVFPDQESCCGMAGDRGAWIPQLVENAQQRFHWDKSHARLGFCSSRTCEAALSCERVKFSSIFTALEMVSRRQSGMI